MPFVTITVHQGLSSDQKRELTGRTSDAVVQIIGAPLEHVRVMLHELPDGHYLNGGKYGTPAAMFVVEMIRGRTEEKKAALIAEFSKIGHETTGTPFEQVRSRILDYPNTDMGMPGGITAKQAGR